MAARAWWLDERCFAVEKVGEEPHALRAHDLARILVDECIYAVTQNSSFRHLHVLELFAPHGLHRKPPQRRYGAYVFTDRHVFLLKRFRAISWPSTHSQRCPAAFGDGRSTMCDPFLVGKN